MVISQRHFGHKPRCHLWPAGLLLVWTLLAAGCIHLTDYDRLKFRGGPPAGSPPPVAGKVETPGLIRWTAGAGVVLTGIGLVGWRWLRLRREGGRAQAMDREDLALLRTARDALVFLLRKRFQRLGVAALRDYRRGRGRRES